MLDRLSEMKLRHLAAKAIYGGDFNMITSLVEKKGVIRTLNKDAEAFNNFIRAAKLVDILPKNGLYTWTKKRGGDRRISSRLDRFLIAEAILLEGVTLESYIIPCGGSDHWPINLDAAILGTPKNRRFKFENFWLGHLEFLTNIKNWSQELLETRGAKM